MLKFYKPYYFILFFVSFGFCSSAISQTVNGNYTFTAVGGSWTANASPTTIHAAGVDDAISAAINIGFTFSYGCTNFTQFKASSNGWMTLGTSISSSYTFNDLDGTTGPIIAPLWDDLAVGSTGTVNYRLTGTAPNRILTVEWRQMEWTYSASAWAIEFQVKLYETSNRIEFIYNRNGSDIFNIAGSPSASIGISGGTLGDFYSLNGVGAAPSASTTVETDNLNSKPATGQIYRWDISQCSGTPTAGTASASPGTVCPGGSSALSVTGSSIGCGLTYQWQSSPNPITVWTNIAVATSATYVASPAASTNYRRVITCTISGLSANSGSVLVTVGTPAYATLPYSQMFEGPWINYCNTRDVPNNSWNNSPSSGNQSWRRQDDGVASAGWGSLTGVYTPGSSQGSYSACFNSYNASTGTQGILDLYVNLSPAGTKSLCFDYINLGSPDPNDVMDVLLSTNGGATFPTTLLSLANTTGWTTQSATIASTSATCVIRFRATSDFGSSGENIGIDNLSLAIPGVPNCATYTSPANGATNITCGINAILNWNAPAVTACNPASSYDVYFGTSPAPPYITNVTFTSYNPGTLAVSTTYYWRIVPRNSAGAAACATVWSFSTGASFNPSQTTPPITDGFENCTDWILVNGAEPNKWLRGTATAYTGSNSMYINNTASNNNYNETVLSVVHFYKDITFPAGNNDYSLRFYWKGMGESCCDYLRVYFAPASVTPVAGTQVSSTYELTPYVYNQSATWQYFNNTLPVGCGGNETWRLIFSWRNDGSVGTQPPAAVDDIQVTTAPRTGTTCANPVNVTLPYTKTGETTKCFNNDYTNASVASCGSSYESGEDKVYKVLVGAAGCVNVTLSNVSDASIGFQIYNGCPDVSGSTCIFNTTTGATGGTLTADINIPSAGFYYLIVDNWAAPPNVNYDIAISAPGGNNPADVVCGATILTLGTSASGDNTCTNATGEPAAPACWTTGAMNTVWYRVTIPASRDLAIKTTAGSLLKTQIDVYRGNACGSLTYVNCNQDAASCGTSYDHSYLLINNIGAGTYAYIRVDGEDNLVGTFSILVIDGNGGSPAWPPTVGQDCGPVTTYTNPICGQSTYVSNPGNFAFGNICDFTGASICLASGERSSIWYTININANGNLEFDIVPNDYGNPNPITGQVNPGYTSSGDETDYDFALWRWEAACDGLADNTFCCTEIAAGTTAATRCDYSFLGATGLFSAAADAAPPAYAPAFNAAYEARLPVLAGETYVLAISNYANDYVSGYTLIFSGTSPVAYSVPGATLTWGSSTSNSWAQPGNWGGCGPPNCSINAIIASGGAQPVISSNMSVKDITINASATLQINANCTLTVCGNFVNNGTLTMAPSSVLLFNNGSVVQNISGSLTGTNKIGGLVINKTGGSVILAAATPIDIGGNFVTQNTTSIFNANNNVVKIAGNFSTASNVTITSFPNVEFNGTIPQTYTNSAGTITWTNVTMNNSGGGMTLTGTATSNLVIAGALTLTNGIIYTANPPLLIMNAGSSATSGSASSFVDGPMRKIGSTAFVFPLGDAFNRWARLGISAPTAASTFQAQYFYVPYSNITSMCGAPAPVLNNVSGFEYWQLNRAAGTGNATVTLYWENAASSGINSCVGAPNTGDLVVARYAGTCWENKNTVGGTYTGSCAGTSAGTVTSDVVTAFSPFTFGSKSPVSNPLPIGLLYFTGRSDGSENILEWATASETNNDYFTLERATDGYNYETIAIVDGAGNSSTMKKYKHTDTKPIIGNNYYRLKQTDFDGKLSYAPNIVVLVSEEPVDYVLFPNPANNEIMIFTTSAQEESILIDITDMFGRNMIRQKPLTVKGNNEAQRIDLSDISEGVYFVTINDAGNKVILQKKFVKIK